MKNVPLIWGNLISDKWSIFPKESQHLNFTRVPLDHKALKPAPPSEAGDPQGTAEQRSGE